MTALMKVIDPGLHTTIQDLGRHGYQEFGIGPSGPMDPWAFKLANLLAGNNQKEAVLEITMVGPTVLFMENTVISLAGANLSPTIDGKKVMMWQSIYVKKGQELRFGKPKHGARSYLAIAGGIQTDKILGSRATNVRAVLGGVDGEALNSRDEVPGIVLKDSILKKRGGKHLSHSLRAYYRPHQIVRVIPDEQAAFFTQDSQEDFYNETFKITAQSDRMGYRLEGKGLERKKDGEILSDAVAFGSIQVPRGGAPIILMADRQTTGGYPKIGTIISHDLWRVAQLLPGQTITFEKTTLEEAHRCLEAEANVCKVLEMAIKQR
ncbi:KipI antagonist [Salipaludibacillus neizhouensis]|uniref:KipI antagonist n=1 Tax=Salipaludibacillus neizhouensis TaxID=885475 RepID=A0A3A9K5S8_9BACI|nr:biotin-dependent carboxyltransferase family protein [Salipaludibacillus neizhouensis]RKL67927.1 KipI antagonist [Salipaludibacillus neizhouensis]